MTDQSKTTDEERRMAYGWCPKCGAGNDAAGYAHLPTCPTLKPQTTNLPTWHECSVKSLGGINRLTALEQFILDNEPAGPSDILWRDQLAAVVKEVRDA